MTEPRASAIVVNWNGLGYVEESVESLLDQRFDGLEVIVVDNGSTDASPESLEARFGARIRLLRAGRNLGFGAGNNLALRVAGGRHLVLLNNDAVAAPGFVAELVAVAESGPRVGMVAAKVLDYERRDRIDTLGHLMYPDGLNRGRGRLETDAGQYDGCHEALFPSGAAALYRRDLIDDVGLFDESLFLYGDDAELGLRARLMGWQCRLAPRAVAYHHYSRSAGAYSSLKAFHVERNRLLLLLKLFPWPLVLLSPAYTAARLALHALGGVGGRGAAGRLARERSAAHLVGVTLRAWLAALRAAPATLAERRRLRQRRRLGTEAFVRLLDAYRLTAREVALRD